MVVYVCNRVPGRLRQEDHGEFKVSLDYTDVSNTPSPPKLNAYRLT